MHSKFYLFWTALVAVAVVSSIPQAQAADPALRCEAGKLTASSRYAACRLKAEAKGILRGLPADFIKCETRFAKRFNKAESKAGPGICPSEGDEGSTNTRITTDAAEIATLLAGGTLVCGNASVDSGEQCDGVDLAGADCATLGFTGGALACTGSCFYDVTGCAGASGGGLFPGLDPILPATGQASVFGAGSDGDVRAGVALSYTDNGDGTITDNNTGLMWEKKDDNNSGGIHDKDNAYKWSKGTNDMDGTMVTTFLDTLNDVVGGGVSCFAGHCDWRIPNYKELVSILDLKVLFPSIDPAFHQSATCTGCTDVTLATCSCTASSDYWSSTTFATGPGVVWFVGFDFGVVDVTNKNFSRQVRAVRGGL